eukprot:UN26531
MTFICFRCGDFYIGAVTLRCTKGEVSVVSGECNHKTCCTDDRCTTITKEIGLADDTISTGKTMKPTDEPLEVNCPSGFTGSITFTCNNGGIVSDSGTCAGEGCAEGTSTSGVAYPALSSSTVRTYNCLPSHNGDVIVTCYAAEATVVDTCEYYCSKTQINTDF